VSELISERPWTEVIGLRRRGVRAMLIMTALAALGGWIWLGLSPAVVWAGCVLALMLVNRVIWSWIERAPRPGRGMEAVLTGSTFVYTAVYCGLPTLLITHGAGATPVVGGVSMIIAIALSSTSEMVISRRVGAGSTAALLLATLFIIGSRGRTESLPELAFALAAVLALHVCIFQFAMHRVRADRAMRGAVAEAEAANAAKSTFLATMSHEIRTPLNGVLGMAQAMDTEALSGVQREQLGIIRESGEALKTILNDVLDLSKIEAGKLEIEHIPFDLERTLRTATAPFQPLAAEKALVLTLTVEPSAAGLYRGDPIRLRQVIGNLLSNALKFTDAGGVSVTATRPDGRLTIVVTDTGAGIPDDRVEHLFDKFAQLDASTTRRHGGTGLGLAICRDLCRLMDGDIVGEGRPGAGSSFTVTLGLPWIGPAAADTGAETPGAGAGRDIAALRVLAAEDNRVNQIVLRTLLAQVGVALHMVENGADAIEAWAGGSWDLILMDIHMPVMDGVSAVREIRSREAAGGLPRTPVVALTANAMTHQIAALMAEGMDAHVAKPIDIGQLFAGIEAALANAAAVGGGRDDRAARA